MCKYIGIFVFILGGGGLMVQQYLAIQERNRFLQEMNQSLLRLHQNISKRNLPVGAALCKEQGQCDEALARYYRAIYERLQENKYNQMFMLFWQEMTPELERLTKEEERRLWVQALCSLFLVESPGEDAGFFAYYEGFADMLKRDDSTKKERQKVTACTTGLGLLTLLLFLL